MLLYFFRKVILSLFFSVIFAICEENWYSYDIYQRILKQANFEIYSPSNHPFRLWKIREISPYLTNLIHQAKIPNNIMNKLSSKHLSQFLPISNISNLTTYNSMESYPKCFNNVRDQGKCRANWAFTLASSLSSSFCIKRNNTNYVELSAQKLISCSHWSGCNDSPEIMGYWLKNYINYNGITEENCNPYSASEGTYIESCIENKCKVKNTEIFTYKANITFIIIKESNSNEKILLIKDNIVKYGSIVGVFSYFEDFIYYKSGIYKSIFNAEKLGVIYLKVLINLILDVWMGNNCKRREILVN